MYTFYFHGHYTTVASVCTAYFPDLRKGKGDESRRNRHSNQKNKKTSKKERKKVKKGIDKAGRIWYSNKAVGAVMSRAGKK